MSLTAIVPARGGSTRLKNKNIKDLCGKPLIFYTLDAFLGHAEVENVIFTSDSPDYCDLVWKEYLNEVDIIHRPADYALNTTKVVDEIERLLIENSNLFVGEWFLMGLPTAPLRTKLDVKKLLNHYSDTGRGCFSCNAYDFPVQFAFSLNSDKNIETQNWSPMLGDASPMITGLTRSQDIAMSYRPNGAIYLTSKVNFLKNKLLYENCDAVDIGQMAGLDVDTELDFKIVETVMLERQKHAS
jgi:CMP-N,N'-diacetyllegionaminic acid synthase